MDDVPGIDLLELMKQRALAKLELVADRLRAHQASRVSVSVAWDYPAYQGIIRRAEQSRPISSLSAVTAAGTGQPGFCD